MIAPPAPVAFPIAEAPGPGDATEVAPGVLWMRLPLPMALNHVNVYALDDGDGWTIIDTGLDTAKTRAIWETLLAGPLRGRAVRRVIVTHYHPDHAGLAGWFQAREADLWATRTSWLLARMLTLDVQERPLPETLAFWRAAGMNADLLAVRQAERPFNFADCVAPLPLGYHRIVGGDVIVAAGREWHVRIGHGHAPEHATFWSETDGIVLMGDQVLAGITPNIGVYATEPEADPLAEWLASILDLSAYARDRHLVLPGHRLPFTGLPARLDEMARHHAGTLDRLQEALDVPATACGLFPVLFGRDIPDSEYGLALVEAVAHLNHLRATGRAIRRSGEDGVWLWQSVE